MRTPKAYVFLIHVQYLGFRYHGWLKQPGVKTVEGMIEKTLGCILGEDNFKILGTSRTDSKVSANHSAFMLFVDNSFGVERLKKDLNENLPSDIRVIRIEQKTTGFNIINTPKIKEYLYLFAFGRKSHPFSAALMTTFNGTLDIEQMKKGAKVFEGCHNFVQYCTKPNPKTRLEREIMTCRIEKNTAYQASFFPENSWMLRIQAQGFLRYQVRLIMGQLLRLGQNRIQLEDIVKSLQGHDRRPLREIAPASGLILNKIIFQE